MLKNISQLSHKIGEKSYQFLCDMDSPLPDVKDALFQFLKCIGQIEDAIKAQQDSEEKKKSSEEQNPEQVEDGNKQ